MVVPGPVLRSGRVTGSGHLPAEILRSMMTPDGTEALVYALLTSGKITLAGRQYATIVGKAAPSVRSEYVRLAPLVAGLAGAQRLQLLELVGPTMPAWELSRREAVRETMNRLVHADDVVDLFEMAVVRFVERAMGIEPRLVGRRRRVGDVAGACGVLFSCLAFWCSPDAAAQVQAMTRAWESLDPDGPRYGCQPEQCTVVALEQALIALREATPGVRQQVLDAAVSAILADERITPRESDMVWTVAQALDCPPPRIGPTRT